MLLCSMGGDETLRVRAWRSPAGTLQGMDSVWNASRVVAESSSVLFTLRVRCGLKLTDSSEWRKPALITDNPAFLEWNAKEAQRLA